METDRDNEETRVRPAWVIIAGVAVITPPLMSVFAYLVLTMFAGDVDVAAGFDLSIETVDGIVAVLGGLLAGLAVALLARLRNWKIVIPPLAAAGAGLVTHLVVQAVGSTSNGPPWFVWAAQAFAMFITIVVLAYDDGEGIQASRR